MYKKSKNIYGKYRENIDLHDIHELVEIGLDKDEISKELGISKTYVKKLLDDYYNDY